MSDLPVQPKFTGLFKRRLKGVSQKYRQIPTDVQPAIDRMIEGNFIGNQITGIQ
ncbi:hypothetical protein [Microcoleus sp. LEGE 07076]|uniref:hypothetical protein n=1 Tax=Microcoleus sp. LEGE 07076 TaxID=915322 RepID=UPI001D13E840|nr:hypothetical protein [Microcoleus sp. LEGE 07076]